MYARSFFVDLLGAAARMSDSFMEALSGRHKVRRVCSVLGVSRGSATSPTSDRRGLPIPGGNDGSVLTPNRRLVSTRAAVPGNRPMDFSIVGEAHRMTGEHAEPVA